MKKKRRGEYKGEVEAREARVEGEGSEEGGREWGERATAAALLFSGTRGCLRWLKISARLDSRARRPSFFSISVLAV